MQNNLEFIKTDDGSFTCFNSDLKEKYHSQCGAIMESLEKYVTPLEIKDNMRILDFCFGLGYNSIVSTKNRKKLEITGLENDPNILKMIKNLKVKKEFEDKFDQFSAIFEKKKIVDDEGNSINLILGDALIEILSLPDNYFDRVFFDPFSPKKQPEMWTEEVFTQIFRVLKKGGKLATYSCASILRNNLKLVGFKVYDGPSVGRRSPSTIAEK